MVYSGYSSETHEKVAIKFFSPREDPGPEKKERLYRLFKNEIRKTQAINHWNIVKVLDWGEKQSGEATIPFTVMEFVPRSLRDCLKGNLSLLTKLFYCAQLCDAVAYINWRGRLVHRDIKPENVLVTPNGLIKVCDLGVASLFPEFERDMVASLGLYPESIGKEHPRHYFSPEQLRRARGADADISRSDIFQVGKVLHEIFTGQNPVGQLNITDKMYETVPKHVRLVIRDLLAEDPDARPPLEHCSCILYVTLGICFSKTIKKYNRLTRAARKDLADFFKSVESFSMDRQEAYNNQYLAHSLGLRQLSQLGLINVIDPYDVGGSWSFFPKIEKYRAFSIEKFTIALTTQGIDLRNGVTGNSDWLNFLRLGVVDLQKLPTASSQAYADKAFQEPPKKWDMLAMERYVSEYSFLISKEKRAFYYIFPPLFIEGRWYIEIHGSPNLNRTGALLDPRILNWGTGYNVPWHLAQGQTKQDALKAAQDRLIQEEIPVAEVERAVSSYEGSKPGRWLNVSRDRLLSHSFFDQLISDNKGRPIGLKIGRQEGALPDFDFKKVEILRVEELHNEEEPINFDGLIKSILAAGEVSTELQAVAERLFTRPMVIEKKDSLSEFFSMVLSVSWSCECTIGFTDGVWRVQIKEVERKLIGGEPTESLLRIVDARKSRKKQRLSTE